MPSSDWLCYSRSTLWQKVCFQSVCEEDLDESFEQLVDLNNKIIRPQFLLHNSWRGYHAIEISSS